MLIGYGMPAVQSVSLVGGTWLTTDAGAALFDGKPGRRSRISRSGALSINIVLAEAIVPGIVAVLGLNVPPGVQVSAAGATATTIRLPDGTVCAWLFPPAGGPVSSVAVQIDTVVANVEVGEVAIFRSVDVGISDGWAVAPINTSMHTRTKGGQVNTVGVDLSKQLAGVKVTLGKLTLSADSAEAKEQLAAYLGDMTDRLFTEAVRVAGFGGQLDGYFEAADVFSAVSASIALAVGNADELGRALNGLEIDKVNKAVDYFQDLASVAGSDLATQIEKVTGLLGNYATLMADVSTQLLIGNLTGYQTQALTVERTYRQQVKAANDYAKALGLSGARAEDLAKIEALRATNMGKLQAQIDADKKAMTYGLSVSDLSPLTDQEKLQTTMRELERAVSGGDSSAAQAAAQAALGFGRNLYASGNDYRALYGQVTGLIDSMKVGSLDLEDGTTMGQLADTIEALPDNFSRAVFDLVVDNKGQAATTTAVQQSNALLAEQNQVLRSLLQVTTQGVRTSTSTAMREALNAR